MAADRRYSEREIAYILEQASAAQDVQPSALPGNEGLSLVQLKEVAAEVGIGGEFVERAAAAVDRGNLIPTERRTWLGLPIGVSRTVEFGRPVTDAEWDRLVVLLRETFDARGRLHHQGAFRQWTNGNLQALLEPTEHGHRLRLSTRKGDARLFMGMGVGGLVAAAASLAAAVTAGGAAPPIWVSGLYALFGAASIGSVFVRLPRWARIRSRQMEAIAVEATAQRLSPPSTE